LPAQQIEKQFGKGSILRLDRGPIGPVSVISTGSISVDSALAWAAYRAGALRNLRPEIVGKTTMRCRIIARAQKAGRHRGFYRRSHTRSIRPMRRSWRGRRHRCIAAGLGEQALEITSHLVGSGQIDVLVVDSVAALVPKSELEGEWATATMGVPGRG